MGFGFPANGFIGCPALPQEALACKRRIHLWLAWPLIVPADIPLPTQMDCNRSPRSCAGRLYTNCITWRHYLRHYTLSTPLAARSLVIFDHPSWFYLIDPLVEIKSCPDWSFN
ncbi:hypothetical protein SAY87_004622 [Trapa incisa]|uniref:Uncharacterized protein n=1 Tax=Trapa incisa TaxID=236973 RepID=A0AAN7JP49_9MYRT|nr:hypothetical protein SAY87_004622 [Trapa incisa]